MTKRTSVGAISHQRTAERLVDIAILGRTPGPRPTPSSACSRLDEAGLIGEVRARGDPRGPGFRPTACSPIQLQPKLNLPRRGCRVVDQTRTGRDRTRRRKCADDRQPEVGMVDQVEELGAKLKVEAFHQAKGLEQRSVYREQAGAFENVPARISVEAGHRQKECMRIEPFSLLPYDDRPAESRIERNAIRVSGVPAPGLIESHQRREGETTLRGDNSIQLPAAEKCIPEDRK